MAGYITKESYSVDEVLSHTGEKEPKKMFSGVMVNMHSQRYQVFKKSCTCSSCGLKGDVMKLQTHKPSKKSLKRYKKQGKKINNACVVYHFNMYGTKDGEEIQFTKDHIIPKSKGGKNYIKNYQTMCRVCNEKKGCD